MNPIFFDRTKLSARFCRVAIVCILLALLCELLLSNFHNLFTCDRSLDEIDLTSYCEDDILDENGYLILMPSQSGSGILTFSDVPGGISTLSFDIRYSDATVEDELPAVFLTVTATDPRTSWQNKGRITIAAERFAVGERGAFRAVTVYASLKSDSVGDIVLSFEGLDGIAEIRDIRLNTPPALGFSFLRFLLIALACMILGALSVTGLLYTNYDPDNLRHRHGAKTAVLFTLSLALIFVSLFLYSAESIAYPLESAVRYYQPYIQQFDAFMKGQLHLDVPVSDELLALENPYDFLSRVDADPLWDRAYYDGNYYSYFGIAPIIFVYFPYYLLSGELPADSFVMTVFLLMTAVFLPLAVLKWVDLHEKKRIPLPVVWLGAVTAFVGSMMLLIARSVTPFYYIATLAASAFLSLFLYLILKAAEAVRLRDRIFFFVFAGLAYALLLHSRLNIALLAAFIVVPFLIFRVLKKREATDAVGKATDTDKVEETADTNEIGSKNAKESPAVPSLTACIGAFFAPPKEILCSLVALGLPVVIGLGVLLYLNAARFGSIFEFGTSYQLTVSDIRYNALSLGDLFPALYHYFFQRLDLSPFFPYVSIGRESISDYGHYVYTDANFGLFSLPLMRALFLAPAICFLKQRTRYEKTLLISLLIGLVTVALLDFSLGGVIYRYVADLTVLASLGAVFLVFALYGAVTEQITDDPGKVTGVKKAFVTCVLLFFLVSCAIPLLLSISYNSNLAKYASDVFIALKELFTVG